MIGQVGDNLASLVTLRTQRLTQFALRKAQLEARRVAPPSKSPADVIATENLRATLTALDAETIANTRAKNQIGVADGALGEISSLLTEVKGLVVANGDGLLSDDEKAANQLQIDSILASVDRLAGTTSFAGVKLLDGTATLSSSGKKLAIDSATSSQVGEVEIDGDSHSLKSLKTGGGLSSEDAATVIDSAITDVATRRAKLGSFEKHHIDARLASVDKAHVELASAYSKLAALDDAFGAARDIRGTLLNAVAGGVNKDANRGHILDLLR